MVTEPRRLIPRRLTQRWFTTRGWPFFYGVTWLLASVFLRPVTITVPGWIPAVSFGMAGVAMLWLFVDPESHTARVAGVGTTVFAATGRAWSIVVYGTIDTGTTLAGCAFWLLLAYSAWMLANLTSTAPNRR